MAALVMEFPLLDETDRRRCSGQEPRSHPHRRGDDRHGRAGATTAVAVTEAALARIEQRNPALNRSTAITAARALAPARAARQLAPSMFATLATAAAAAPVPSRAVARSRSDADRRGDHSRAVVGNRRVADRLGIGATRRDRGHEDGLSRLALLKILSGRRI
jgi:hypothetical protein